MAEDKNVIPFTDGAPPDDLQVEETDDGNVLIGEAEETTEPKTDFYSNLAEQIDERELLVHSSELLDYYQTDREARANWEERYKEGLKTLDPDGGLQEADSERAARG